MEEFDRMHEAEDENWRLDDLIDKGGRVRSDTMVRCNGQTWPVWIKQIRQVMAGARDDQADELISRIKAGLVPAEFEHDEGMKARLQRAAYLTAAEFGRGLAPVLTTESRQQALEDQVFRDAMREWHSDPGPHAGNRPDPGNWVSTHVLLIITADSKTSGQVAELVFRRLPALPHHCEEVPIVRAPASFILRTNAQFEASLKRTSRLLKEWVDPAVTETLALSWDLRPLSNAKPTEALLGVGGESASATMAVAALKLLRKHVNRNKADLLLIEVHRLAISAVLGDDLESLQTVGGIEDKVHAWNELPKSLRRPAFLFVAPSQFPGARLQEIQFESVGTLNDLITKAAGRTGASLSPEQTRLYDLVAQDEPVADTALLTRVADDRDGVRSVLGYLLHRFAHWAAPRPRVFGPGQGALEARFVNLYLETDLGAQSPGERYTQAGPFESIQSLIAEPEKNASGVGGWLLLAEPGAGKTTVLAHHELESAKRLLRLHLQEGHELMGVCLWFEISGAKDAINNAGRWLSDRWEETYPNMPALEEVIRDHHPRFILDAINEIGKTNRDEREHAMRDILQWIRDKAAVAKPPLLSVRSLEPVALSTEQHPVLHVRLQRWTPEQMESYCKKELGEANLLWLAINQSPELTDLCSLPFHLASQCALLKHGVVENPAADKAELMSGLVWLALTREVGKNGIGQGLLSELDKAALADPPRHMTRVQLLRLPSEGPLLRGLEKVAFAMQGNAKSGDAQIHMREAEVDCGLLGPERGNWMNAVFALGLCKRELPTNPMFSFTLQGWQEFFAARALLRLTRSQWPDFRPPAMKRFFVAAAGLGKGDSLPGPPISDWEEAVKVAAQIHDQPQELIAHLAGVEIGPIIISTLACHVAAVWKGIKTRPARLLRRMRSRLRQRLIAYLARSEGGRVVLLALFGALYYVAAWSERSKARHAGFLVWQRRKGGAAVNLALAGRAAAAWSHEVKVHHAGLLGFLRRSLLERSRDASVDVRLRVEAGEILGDLGDPRYTDGRQHRHLGNPCLVPTPEYWVRIPAGRHCLDRDAHMTVELPAFDIAFAPVTNAEYRAFIDDAGYSNSQWWTEAGARLGYDNRPLWWLRAREGASLDRRNMNLGTTREANPLLRARERLSLERRNVDHDPREVAEEKLRFSERIREPLGWEYATFNNPAQPVAGVCLYEALAYCRWLSATTGWQVFLPRECEWEAVALTHGPEDDDRAPGGNHASVRLGRPSPIGVFPGNDRLDGKVVDLFGLLAEWTVSRAYHDGSSQAEERFDPNVLRVLRGGFDSDDYEYRDSDKASRRIPELPFSRHSSFGFRLYRRPVEP
jgi:formylglycine-generating enzyme required for sulfatase activity